MTFDISKNILTVPEVAFILNCSSQKVYELIHLKKIYAFRVPFVKLRQTQRF